MDLSPDPEGGSGCVCAWGEAGRAGRTGGGAAVGPQALTLSRPLPVSVCPAKSPGLKGCLSRPSLLCPGTEVGMTDTGMQDLHPD